MVQPLSFIPSSFDFEKINAEALYFSNICPLTKETVKLQEMSGAIQEHIGACKKLIKEYKQLDADENVVATIEKIEGLKDQLFTVQDQIRHQESIIAHRINLYNDNSLPIENSFQTHLKRILKIHPEWKDDIENMHYIMDCRTRTVQGEITFAQFEQLKAFSLILNDHAQIFEDLLSVVTNEIAVIEESLDRKQQLLKGLCDDLPLSTKFSSWPAQDKLLFYVKFQQFYYNPFSPPIYLSDFLHFSHIEQSEEMTCLIERAAKEQSTRLSISKKFWDFLPVFEKKARRLALKKNLQNELVAMKLEGLKTIIASNPVPADENEKILIIGGGPAGLFKALTLTLMGKNYTLIEKRSSENQNRENAVTLGKDEPKDLTLLLFFGILNQWENEGAASFAHLRKQLIEVRISQIEDSLKETLDQLQQKDKLLFSHTIEDIQNVDGQGVFTIKNQDDSDDMTSFTPSLVVAADGGSSLTRDLLGINKVPLGKTTQIAYSTLITPEALEKSKSKYFVKNFFKGAGLVFSAIVHSITHFCSLEESFGCVDEGGVSAIFRLRDYDYLIRCLKKEQQDINDSYNKKIHYYERKLKRQLAKEEINQQKIDAINIELQILRERRNDHLANHAKKTHEKLDCLSSLYSKNHTLRPMEPNHHYLVDITVAKAEKNFTQVGQTLVLLRGDASHMTDPRSGYGCKTAIEESFADQYLFSATSSHNELMSSYQSKSHDKYLDKMINLGFKRRRTYHKDTEIFARYTDLAKRQDLLNPDEINFLEKMYMLLTAEGNIATEVTAENIQGINQILEKLAKHLQDEQGNIRKFKSPSRARLTMREKRALKAFLKDFQAPLSDKKQLRMRLASAKLAYEGEDLAAVFGILSSFQALDLNRTDIA